MYDKKLEKRILLTNCAKYSKKVNVIIKYQNNIQIRKERTLIVNQKNNLCSASREHYEWRVKMRLLLSVTF